MRLLSLPIVAVAAAGLVSCGDGPTDPSITGDRVVFTRSLPSGSDIFAISDTGGPATQLTQLSGFANGAVVSSDGRLIAFTHELTASEREIYVMRADGSQGRAVLIENAAVIGWTPEGDLVLRDLDLDPSPRYSTVRTDGSGRTALPQFDAAEHIAISPDGGRVAYSQFEDDGLHIFVADRDGGNPVALTAGPFQDQVPGWSPDGQWIAFASDRLIGEGLLAPWLVRADGSEMRQVGSTAIVTAPTWSPDGTRLLCGLLNDQSGVDHDVIVFDVATGDVTNLTESLGGDEILPAWAPEPE